MKKYLRLIGILLFIIILLSIDTKAVWNSFYHANWLILFFVASFNVVVMFLRSWRWAKLVEIQQYSFGVLEAFWSYIRSFYFGSVTPARVGELSRAHYLMKYTNTSSATAVSSVIFDRILDMYFMLIFGIVGLVMSTIWSGYYWLRLVFILMMLLIPLFIIFPKGTLSLASLLPNYWNIREKSVSWLENFFEAIQSFLTFKIAFSVFLTVIINFLFFVQCLMLAYAMNLNIDFFYLAFCVVLFSILSVLPISVSNMGTREFVLIFMFSYIDLSSALAVSYSLLFFLTINFVTAALGWLAYVFYKDKVEVEVERIEV